ncbi:MAG: TetR/AcrR family transcriptional regulator [Opitutaceae bacterium]|nr:TetR/AcrR family transcriptional regulator [Opitutaceae bacterium]
MADDLSSTQDSRLAQGQETRHHILRVAGQLFADQGFDGTGLRDIGAAADVGLSNILYHFKSKEGLYLATIEHFTLELGRLNQHFALLFVVDPKDRPAMADAFHQSIRSFLHACHGPDSVCNLLGLYLRVLAEGNEAALEMLLRCFADVQAALPPFFKRVKPDMSDHEAAFMQQLLWSLLQYTVVSKRLVLYDMKLTGDYTPEYLDAVAWHIAYYCCLPLGLPAPRRPVEN